MHQAPGNLFARVASDEVARRDHLALHGGKDGGAISGRGIDVELAVLSEDLEVIRMVFACGRLRTDVARRAGDVLALCGAVLETIAGGNAERQSRDRAGNVIDDPVHDRLRTVDAVVLGEDDIRHRAGGTFRPRDGGRNVFTVLRETFGNRITAR